MCGAMSGWQIDVPGARATLSNTETARTLLTTYTSGPADVDTPTRTACGPVPQLADALAHFLEGEIQTAQAVDSLILTAVVGVGLAVKAKEDGQEDMISTFNTATVDGDLETLTAYLPQQP